MEINFENDLDDLDENHMNNEVHIKFEILLKEYYLKYLSLFRAKDKEGLINKLKKLDIDTGSVCARKMIEIGGWKCLDCEKNSNAIICHQCWSKVKEKHNSHNIMYNSSTNGTCDCGDPNTLQSSLFCPIHKGPFTNEKDIQNYINKCFSPEIIQYFEKITKDLIGQIIPYIIDNVSIKSIPFQENIKHFLNILDILSNNKALMHILSKTFLENYKYKTNHSCLLVNNNEINFIQNNKEHDCLCPIIRIIMSTWIDGNQDILFRFLLNYKLRKSMGILYFLLFGYLTKNLINDFSELSVQYIFDDVCTTTVSLPGLIEFYLKSLFQIVKYYTDNNIFNIKEYCPLIQKILSYESEENNYLNTTKKFEDLKNIAQRFFYDSVYLIKPDSAKYLGNNELVYLKLIDILSIFHNINSIISYYPHKNGFYKESFDLNIIFIEYYLLVTFDLYISILNFENIKMIENIFKYFSDIIINKKYKQLLDNEYSFHYSLFRAFSIFLNRYCFYYINSINSQDINDGFKNAINKIPDFQKFGEIILNDLFKLLGYISACGENFLNYYGELMPYNEVYYFDLKEFIFRDFSLLRFFLSDKNFKSNFSIINVIKKSSLENTYNIFEKLFLSELISTANKNLLEEIDNYKFLKFNQKIFKLILNIIRDNKSFIWEIGSSYQTLKNAKLSNKITESIIINDKKNINEICKNIIINEIVSNENLNTFTNVTDAISTSIKEIFGEDKIEELILSMTNKTLTQNKKAKFSIKDEYLKYIDMNSIYNYKQKSNIQKYINNFKKEKLSIYNTYFYPFSKYENILQKNIEHNFFLCQENFDIVFKLTELLLKNEKYFIFQQFFLSELINYWDIFFYIYEKNKESQEYKSFVDKNKNEIEQLLNLLIHNSLNDNSLVNYIFSVVEKITKNKEFINLKNIPTSNINILKIKEKNSNKDSLKEKLKNKFKKKFTQLESKYNIKTLKTEKKIFETCIYCLKPIEENSLDNLYGKIGNIIEDYVYSNAFAQTIKKEYQKYNKNNDLFKKNIQFTKSKGFSIYSCNHFIHLSCFQKLEKNSHYRKCPLCKQNYNLFIPSISQYKNEFIYLIKGYDLSIKPKGNYNKLNITISLEEKNSIQKFRELMDKNETLNNIINCSEEFLFKFIKDIEFDNDNENYKKNLTETIIEKCSEAISNFFDFIENYNDINNKIEHFQNLILIIRLLMKFEKLDSNIAFNNLIKLLKNVYKLDCNNFCEYIFEDNLKKILSKILLLFGILFDYKTINGYEKYIMDIFLPIYIFQYFIKYILICDKFQIDFQILKIKFNTSQFDKYLQRNNNILNPLKFISKYIMLANILSKYNIKIDENISFEIDKVIDKIGLNKYKFKSYNEIKRILDIIKEPNDKTKINLFFEQFFPQKKVKELFTEKYLLSIENYLQLNLILKKNKIYINPNLLGSCLPIKYNFIYLPPIALDFQYIFFNIPCFYCKKIGYPSYICLTCGKKVCQKENRCAIYKPITKHNKECGGGRSIFINTFNYKVVLCVDNNSLEMDIPFYVNKFGESIEGNTTSKDIKLNEEEINKALQIFIDYSWTNHIKNLDYLLDLNLFNFP